MVTGMKVKVGEYYYHDLRIDDCCVNLVTEIWESDGGFGKKVIMYDNYRGAHENGWGGRFYADGLHFKSIWIKIRATKLAKKMYPNNKIEGDYIKVVDKRFLEGYNKIQEYLKEIK